MELVNKPWELDMPRQFEYSELSIYTELLWVSELLRSDCLTRQFIIRAAFLVDSFPPLSFTSPEENEKFIGEVLSYPILLSEHILKAVSEAKLFKGECSKVEKQTEKIGQMLRSAARIATSPGSLYERPVRMIVADVSRKFVEAITLVRKCRRHSVLRRVMTIVSVSDFRKLLLLLDASVGDMKWLLSIFDVGEGEGITISIPPITSNDPILSWTWTHIASLYMCQVGDKVEAANELASLAKDNDRNKKIIVEEGGVLPLLKLLKDATSVDAQIAPATTLLCLANDEERVLSIIWEFGVSIIVQVLGNSRAKVQIKLANLVARMAEHSSVARDDFGRENVIKPLVTLLSRDVFVDEPNFKIGSSFSMHNANHGSKGGHNKKEKEEEDPEVKFRLKISCAEALEMLARGSALNSRRITETRGLLCLARLVEEGQGELLLNCLRVIEEITAAAETNPDLRKAAFKTNSRAAKTVVDQLLKIITEIDRPYLQILAIKSIGSLARTFTARETRVIEPLVKHLDNRNAGVAAEAAIALEKFASPDNFLCMEYSKRIIECEGLSPLRKLLRGTEQTRLHGLILLCYLVLHVRNCEALEQEWVLRALQDRALFKQHPELILQAEYTLNVYHRVFRFNGLYSQLKFGFL